MSHTMTEVITWLSLFGIPSIFAMTTWCVKNCLKYTRHLNILMKAQKAQMRSQLLNQYHEYESQGWISEDDLEDWENQYKAYHELVGENGVLDARRAKLLQMQNSKSVD